MFVKLKTNLGQFRISFFKRDNLFSCHIVRLVFAFLVDFLVITLPDVKHFLFLLKSGVEKSFSKTLTYFLWFFSDYFSIDFACFGLLFWFLYRNRSGRCKVLHITVLMLLQLIIFIYLHYTRLLLVQFTI